MRRIILIGAAIGAAITVGFGVFPGKHDSAKTSMPIGVMIENEIMARPFQQGLSKADIVYEAPTEGNITRFLALFIKSEYNGKVGPVRSARPYFLDWMGEYGGVYAHVGGSDEALNKLRKSSGIFDTDQFFYEKYFWRENVKKTALEHTMFTTLEVLRNLAAEMNWQYSLKSVREIGVDNLKKHPTFPAAEINIDFGLYSSRVKYIYDSDKDEYLRYQNGKPHIDFAVNGHISAKIVAVQRVQSWPMNDSKFRIGIKTAGEGEAVIFFRGLAIKAKWQKSSAEDRTRFFDESGREINFGDGPVWIEIVPVNNTVSYGS